MSVLGPVRAAVVVSGGPVALAAAGVLAPVAVVRRWPDRARPGWVRRAAWAATSAALLASWLEVGLVRPRMRRWGATPQERTRTYPGDIDDALLTTTRAVTVDAPAEVVWSWLVQIGQDRGGFYSYDWLENLAGCQVTSADRIHDEWQHRSPGDELSIFPGYATTIAAADPPRSLLIENWGAYVVEPVDATTCRLIARSHAERGLPGAAYVLLVELPHAVMERKMLLGIKRRAEQSAGTPPPAAGPVESRVSALGASEPWRAR
ncbi:hypothetical protein [Sanguibacter sp. 25GB23B1]|uniref:hypothetical protein n=1 Tax=unclassified Sanguibacter TaxID=2645534 RepID=UPI0032AF3A55